MTADLARRLRRLSQGRPVQQSMLATERVAQWSAGRVYDRGWDEFDVARVDEDFPAGPMMGFTQENAVFNTGFALIDPVSAMVRLTYSRWPIAAQRRTSSISRDKRPADGQRNGSHRPSDVEGLGFPAENNGDYFGVARPPPGLRCADMCPVVQRRGAQIGAQGVQSMVTVRCGGSPALVGQSWAARASPQISSRASALRCSGALVGDGVGDGMGRRELFDQ